MEYLYPAGKEWPPGGGRPLTRLTRGEIPSQVLSMAYGGVWAPWPHLSGKGRPIMVPGRARPWVRPHRIAIGTPLIAGWPLARENDMPESSGGAQSPEDVALKLLYVISWGENIDLEAWGKADRKWIL